MTDFRKPVTIPRHTDLTLAMPHSRSRIPLYPLPPRHLPSGNIYQEEDVWCACVAESASRRQGVYRRAFTKRDEGNETCPSDPPFP